MFKAIPKCIGGTDVDHDGWCASGGSGVPPDPNDLAPGVIPEDYDAFAPLPLSHSGSGATPPMREPVQVCNDGLDNDLDGLVDLLDSGAGNSTCRPKNVATHPGYPACPANGCVGVDTDGDGYAAEAEMTRDRPAGALRGGIDFGAQQRLAIGPVVFRQRRQGHARRRHELHRAGPGEAEHGAGRPGFDVRWDIVPGNTAGADWIVLNDLTSLTAGVTGYPPMFSGVKAFNGPACTAHPAYGD